MYRACIEQEQQHGLITCSLFWIRKQCLKTVVLVVVELLVESRQSTSCQVIVVKQIQPQPKLFPKFFHLCKRTADLLSSSKNKITLTIKGMKAKLSQPGQPIRNRIVPNCDSSSELARPGFAVANIWRVHWRQQTQKADMV